MPTDAYKQGICEGRADDIVYSSLFTGVHGNYLRKSIELAGLDPDNLPEGDIKTMDFGTGDGSKAKAWRDIWGSGQGIGAIDCGAAGGRLCRAADRRICRGEGGAASESALARAAPSARPGRPRDPRPRRRKMKPLRRSAWFEAFSSRQRVGDRPRARPSRRSRPAPSTIACGMAAAFEGAERSYRRSRPRRPRRARP